MACPFCALGFSAGPYPQQDDVRRAFNLKSRITHPDKNQYVMADVDQNDVQAYLGNTAEYAKMLVAGQVPVPGGGCTKHFPQDTRTSTVGGSVHQQCEPGSSSFSASHSSHFAGGQAHQPMQDLWCTSSSFSASHSSNSVGAQAHQPMPETGPSSWGREPFAVVFKCNHCVNRVRTTQTFEGVGSGPYNQARAAGWSKGTYSSWEKNAKCPICNGMK